MNRRLLKTTCILLSCLVFLGPFSGSTYAETNEKEERISGEQGKIDGKAEEGREEGGYYYDYVKDLNPILQTDIDEIIYDISEIKVISPQEIWSLESQEESFEYGNQVLKVAPSSTIEFEIDVPKAAGYHIALDYYVPGNELQDFEIGLAINGEYQFSDSKNIKLPVTWKDREEERRLDIYGNEVYPLSERIHRWNKQLLNSSMYNLKTPFIFRLEQGVNRISIASNEVEYLLGSICLLGKQEYMGYADYRAEIENKDQENKNLEPILIEGEDYSEKSHAHIRGERTKNVNFSPYSTTENLINTLSPTMWQDPIESVSYTFNVDTPGLYNIVLKYQQSTKHEMPVYKNIAIDGEVLFDELMDYRFEYTGTKNQNHVLNIDGEDISFYFDKGDHTITLQSTASVYFDIYESLLYVVRRMNDISLDIKMITGNKVDKNRDWNIDEYIPDLKDQLLKLVEILDESYDKLCDIAGKKDASSIANLKIASNNIEKFTIDQGKKKGLDRLVNNLDYFSQGNGSITEYISSVLTILLEQPMAIDLVYVTQNPNDLPNPNVNPLKAGFEGTKKLFTSFTSDHDESFSTDSTKLNIWVNRPVTHIEVLREMISSGYDSDKLEVNLSAMPDENRLLLSVVAGESPDGVLGLSTTRPFDLALRGAAHDLRNFDDFGATMKDFVPNMYVPFVLEDGCYGIPETANFFVTFYRTDIIDKLGIEVPRTWDELIEVLPVLDRHGMNVNTIISGADAFKHFGCTVPFIQQYEGSLYDDDGMSVTFDDPNTIDAFTLMTDLYIRYDMPERIVNFYNNFKSGITPLGISDMGTYILLKNAAPEIYGQWKISPNIGRINEKGEFLNSQPDVASSCVVMEQSENKQEAWDFIKWWMSAETQLEYGMDLQLRFGKEFVWNTANLNALSKYTYFDNDEKEVILDQVRAAEEIPRHPAYFQVEREMSNAWNQVVFDGIPVREALDKAALSSDRVIAKKLKEFGYMTDTGEIIKPFKVATIDQITSWGEE